ncbi:MAG: sugar phosphate isomerase/epimerase [Kiritimatiellae bacterium]|nr:sugar phosphate isomerase/epimerase [Kiritimatiellia bacterium]
MRLSYMTFVCPDWEMDQVIRFAAETEYDGVEIRVDAGHKHGVSSVSSAEARKDVKRRFQDAGVAIPSVATSVHFACPEPEKRTRNMDAAKANLDLAADLGAPVVRIFAGGGIPELTDDAADRVAAAFDEAGEYAADRGVCPMLECGHDIIRGAAEAAKVIERVNTKNFCTLWNHATMDDATYDVLKDHIRHFHVHKDVLDPADTHINDLAKRMKAAGYAGFVSLEIIEKRNLPEPLLRQTATRLQRIFAEA